MQAVRINFFRGFRYILILMSLHSCSFINGISYMMLVYFRFSLAWWAYTFPMTSASISTIRYATKVKNPFTQSMSIALSSISTVIVVTLILLTIFHGLVLRDLFPNDMSITVAEQLSNTSGKQTGDIEECLSGDGDDV